MDNCSRCDNAFVKTDCTLGYGKAADGTKVCYDCCAVLDRESMIASGKATLYLDDTNGIPEVTNWPGTLRFNAAIKTSRHNFGGTRTDAWFYGPDGSSWWGFQCSDGQLINVRRLKS